MITPSPELLERAARIRLLVLDVDGVLTDGKLWYGPHGEELKSFHARDGLGLRLVMLAGIQVAIVTARRSEALKARVRDLKLDHALLGRDDKLRAFDELRTGSGLTAEACAFVGDDVLDLPVTRAVGLAVAVADAHPLVCAASHFVTRTPGGLGAVREVCDLLLEAQGGMSNHVERFLSTRSGQGETA